MQLLCTFVLCTLLVAGIRGDTESLISPSALRDGSHDYVQQFHHGQQHGSEVVPTSGNLPHLVPNSQVQDQSVIHDQAGHSSVGHGGQVSQVGQGPNSVSPVGPIGPISPVNSVHGHLNQLVPLPYFGQRSEAPIHAGARAIGAPVPVSYYPYFGKTYASPIYGQYQQVPHHGVYQQVYPYPQVTPYSATPYSAVPVPAPVYPGYTGYNYPYYPQYIPYYQQQTGEVQSVVSKQ